MEFFVIIIALVSLLIGGFSYWKSRKLKNDLKIGEQEIKRKMYELAILKELGERMGYSLNVQNIIDIISGSLHQFIEYSVVSYMLINPEKIIFKAHLEKSISKNFFIDIKQRMVKSLSALMDKDFSKVRIEEVLSGAILEENSKEPVSSFFNIPLVIADKVVGVLTVAHSKAGLYKEDEMTILYKIVGQASQAVTKLQEVVLEEQKKLNAMVESMTEGVVMTDKDYRIMVANPASKRNFDIEENKDVTIFDFIEKLEGKFNIRGSLEESVKLKKILVSKEVLINDKFLEITTLPVKNNFGINEEIVGGVVIFHDITKEKEVEKMKEDFTSMIAHELRSPIDQIKKISEVLRTEKIVKKDRNEYLDMVYSSSAGLLEMVNNLLDMAKLEAGKFEILKQFVNIKDIIDERINFFKTSAKDNEIELKSEISKKIPDKVKLDPFRIAQVLNNFISNALKFTNPKGKIAVQAMVHKNGQDINEEAKKYSIKWFIDKWEENANALIISVTDTGNGIPKNEINNLFKKFNQIGVQHKGTGFGLVIAKGIVSAHNGITGVASKEGSGSTFYFTIPL